LAQQAIWVGHSCSRTSTKVIPPICTFSDFLQLLICQAIFENYNANLCESDAITFVSAVFHDETLTPQELHKASFPNCYLSLAKGGGSNTSVTLQMTYLSIFVKEIFCCFLTTMFSTPETVIYNKN